MSQRVREPDVTEAASRVSVHPGVRQWMVARQKEMGAGGGVVMEGRDIGTKVFPEADVKIFLDADPGVREQRRLQQQNVSGAAAHAIVAELRERDRRIVPGRRRRWCRRAMHWCWTPPNCRKMKFYSVSGLVKKQAEAVRPRGDSRPPAVRRSEAPLLFCLSANPCRAALDWTAEGGCPHVVRG